MTMPHLMNCPHSEDWCLSCVKEMHDEYERVIDELKKGRDPEVDAVDRGNLNAFTVNRTGRVYSFASSEFKVTYPDGTEGVVWSPPWHEMSPLDEESSALEFATKLYEKGEHVARR